MTRIKGSDPPAPKEALAGETKRPELIETAYGLLGGRSEYKDFLRLLTDKDLWALMQIPFSPELAELTQQTAEPPTSAPQAKPLPKDEEIIIEAVAKESKKPAKQITESDFENVKTLDLGYTGIKNLDLLNKLPNLQWLSLAGNDLTTVPEALGNMSSLKLLYLYGNQLTTLPEALGNLTSLRRLSLGANQLTTVPETLSKLTSLTHLDLSKNQLTTVRESLGKLTSLELVSLSGNQLSEEEKAGIKKLLPNCVFSF